MGDPLRNINLLPCVVGGGGKCVLKGLYRDEYRGSYGD